MYPFCKNRIVCKPCRNERSFREALCKAYNISDIDFKCPEDIPIGAVVKENPIKKSNASTINTEISKQRYEICKQCEHSTQEGFGCEFYKRCCFGRWRANKESKCPEGHW